LFYQKYEEILRENARSLKVLTLGTYDFEGKSFCGIHNALVGPDPEYRFTHPWIRIQKKYYTDPEYCFALLPSPSAVTGRGFG
jgi:hypothetical protein